MIARVHEEYARRNGRSMRDVPVQGVSYRVQVVVPVDKFEYRPLERPAVVPEPVPIGRRQLLQLGPQPLDAAIYQRESLPPGTRVNGPAIIQEALCTTLVGAGQQMTVGDFGELYIEKAQGVQS
jgi:N-methylhydantoinase A